MISNMWGNTTLLCGKHTEDVEMEIVNKSNALFYICPLCKNEVSVYDFEKMIKHYSKVITDGYAEDEEMNIANRCWRDKLIRYRVVSHIKNKYKVEVINDRC